MAVAAPAAANDERGALLPFVGCVRYESRGPQPVPKEDSQRARHIDPSFADRLAWYSSGRTSFVVAPRGWHCIEARDKERNSVFIVSEAPYSLEDFQTRKPIGGPAVVKVEISPGSANHLVVARAAARYFPKAYPKAIRQAGIGRLASYRHDKLLARYDINKMAIYETPPHRQGLGTEDLLRPEALPIETGISVQADGEGDPDLLKMAVRLPAGSQDIAKPLLEQVFSPVTWLKP